MIERLVRFLPDEIKIYMEWLIFRWSKIKSPGMGFPIVTQACLQMQTLNQLNGFSAFPPVASASPGPSPYPPS